MSAANISFQNGALAEGVGDHLGAPPLLAGQALEQVDSAYGPAMAGPGRGVQVPLDVSS
jgi:hypothetical protein